MRLASVIALFILLAGSLGAAQAATRQEADYHRIYQTVKDRAVNGTAELPALEHKFDGKLNSDRDLGQALDELMASVNGRVLTPGESRAHLARVNSSFIGQGLSYKQESVIGDRGILIKTVFADSTAENAGLEPGDRIIKVDGAAIEGLYIGDASEKIRGTEGTSVYLTVEREGNLIELPVQRDLDETIGVEIENDQPVTIYAVSWVYHDSPAEKAGLVKDDIIIAIDGTSTSSMDSSEITARLGKDELGKQVAITVKRGSETLTVNSTSGLVPSWDLTFGFEGQSGGYQNDLEYNRAIFTIKNVDWSGMDRMLNAFVKDLGDYPGAVIDLRGARGDDHLAAARIAARFVSDDRVLFGVVERRDGKDVNIVYAIKSGALVKNTDGTEEIIETVPDPYKGKIVLLVNGDTAGTAEALVLSLRDAGRAEVVGGSTAGVSVVNATTDPTGGIEVSFPAARLLTASAAELKSIAPDRRILSGDKKAAAVKVLAGKEWYESPDTIVLAMVTLFALVILGLVALSARRKAGQKTPEPEEPPASEPEPETNPEPGPRKRASPWLLLLPLLLVAGILTLPMILDRAINGPPAGAHGKVIVTLYTDSKDSSETSILQQKAVDELASEYNGAIEFVTVDVGKTPDPDVTDVPSVRVSKIWYDASGKEISKSWQQSGKIPKRHLVQMIDNTASSNRQGWPDIDIKRTKRP
ncbi:MAG: PDZ domain-containing protein [Cyanobacteria bacterium HKST-UBA02]|nr:PDZ domain-containing protein [Cyanobacteria bacterium HKST-UBA02]